MRVRTNASDLQGTTALTQFVNLVCHQCQNELLRIIRQRVRHDRVRALGNFLIELRVTLVSDHGQALADRRSNAARVDKMVVGVDYVLKRFLRL